MSWISKQAFFRKKSALGHIIILGIFFIVTSCSTKGPRYPIGYYPDRTGKYDALKDYDFQYRQDRLKKQSKKNQQSMAQNYESL